MVFRCLLLILMLTCGLAYSAPSAECESALKILFNEQVSKQEAGNFLKVQGDLTLHRLSWAYLKAQKSDQTVALENTERTILTLLDDKYTSIDPEFKKARVAFESQPLSRTTLADIAPYLKDVLSHEFPQGSEAFVLNASDLKLLNTLAKYEIKSSSEGHYDSRMLARKSQQGMLNFVKLVNSAYKTGASPNEEALNVELKLQGIEKTLGGLQKKLNDFLNQMDLPTQCKDQALCEEQDLSDIFNQNENIQNIFWASLEDKLQSDDLLLDNLTYGELWVRTSTASVQPLQQKSGAVQEERKTVVGEKIKKSYVSPVQTFYASSTGLYIEDPVAIIVKDASGRKAENWKSFDQKYLEAMSDSVLNDDKVFVYQGKIYDRKTGKILSKEKALEKLPPKMRAEFSTLLKSNDPAFLSRQISAKLNGDRSFIYNNKVFNLEGHAMGPEWIIGHEMTKKTGVSHPAANYKGMDHAYLIVRAEALMNNKPHFTHKNQVYDSETGRNLSSPFRSLASTQDVKLEKQRRVQYQNLSDKETIINFHRDNPKKDGCQHYAVVDKKNAKIYVYSLNGSLVFSEEVLVGIKASDEKTKWTEYNDRNHQGSYTTGAGVFTIGQPKNGDYYAKNYNNHILQIEGQNVFAIHQVPNNLNERYKKFNTGNPLDRRVSQGCVNMRQSDYLTLTKWMKPTCKVYVLPEEQNNKLIVKDGQIQLVSSTSVVHSENYNYSHPKKSYKPIDIRITNPNGKTTDSVPFVKALEDEKQKLMKLFSLSNDEYNELAAVSYAIMGNESDFGRSKKYWIKEHDQGDVILAKAAKRLFSGKNPFDKSVLNTSRGLTQIKELPEGEWKKSYPGINKNNLSDPKNSAVSTIAYLAEASRSLKRLALENAKDPRKVKITKENLVDYLGYIYQGRRGALKSSEDPANADFNTYVQKLRKNMSYIEIAQKIE